MKKIAYINGNVFDGRISSEILFDATILVEFTKNEKLKEGFIVKIGPSNEIQIPADYKIVDLKGKYVIPGLINAHCHLLMDGSPAAMGNVSEKLILRVFKLLSTSIGRKILKKRMRTNSETALNAGVTALRLAGDPFDLDLELKKDIEAGKHPGPRLMATGRTICVTGGHGAYIAYVADGPWEGRKATRHFTRLGSDHIKIIATGGVSDSSKLGEAGRPQMTVEEISAICDEAHRAGLKVMAHCESTAGIRETLQGGVDSIEHGASIPADLIPVFKNNPKSLDGYTTLVSTISAFMDITELDPKDFNISEIIYQNGTVVRDEVISGMKTAIKSGIPVGMGTDASLPFVPHYEFWKELVYYQHFGEISAKQAINIATEQNAKLCGFDSVAGTLEVGKSADFIVLDGNPLENLHVLEHPVHVVYRGNMIKKPTYKLNTKVERYAHQRAFNKLCK